MATTKSWINAARPRTLPLALSGILMGCGLAWYYGVIDVWVSVLAIVTATLIQVFSNFANDYGDSQKGTDNRHRIGPLRTVQSGEISQKEMEDGMIVVGSLSFLSGILLVYLATWNSSKPAFFPSYRVGNSFAYSRLFLYRRKKIIRLYRVGRPVCVPVFRTFTRTGRILPECRIPARLPCSACNQHWLFSTGVLNLNNMRDIENDRRSGKITIPVRIGANKSRYYHQALITGGWIAAVAYTLMQEQSVWQWLYLLTLPFYLFDLKRINRIKADRELDPFLKRLALSTLAFTLLFIIGFILSAK
jgi:1,4-dihydroxy-2-naphthoate polyprenyltransferase